MRLVRFLTLHIFGPLASRRALPPGAIRIPILMYHSISDDPEAGHPYYWINTSPALFAEQMQYLADHGYEVIPLSRTVEIIKQGPRSKVQGPRNSAHLSTGSVDQSTNNPSPLAHLRQVVLTFDDGYRDFATEAFPVLQRYGFTATVFLPTDYIDGTKPGLRGKAHLTWDQVRELATAGITFGSHTCSHPQLLDARSEEIERELSASKQAIETHLNQPVAGSERINESTSQRINGLGEPISVDSFCYPYKFPEQNKGFVERFNETLKKVGYDACASTRIGTINATEDILALKRIPVNSGDDLPLFGAKLSGGYDWLATVQTALKKVVARNP